jgi:hypothetical protein
MVGNLTPKALIMVISASNHEQWSRACFWIGNEERQFLLWLAEVRNSKVRGPAPGTLLFILKRKVKQLFGMHTQDHVWHAGCLDLFII